MKFNELQQSIFGVPIQEADTFRIGSKKVSYYIDSATPFVILTDPHPILKTGKNGVTHDDITDNIFVHRKNPKLLKSFLGVSDEVAQKISDDLKDFKYYDQFVNGYDSILRGRYFNLDHYKVLSFWVTRGQKVTKSLIDFALDQLKVPKADRDEIRLQFSKDYKRDQVYEKMPTYKQFASGNGGDVVGKIKPEDRAKLHVQSPLKLSAAERAEKKRMGKGFGSDKKKGGKTATRYHQMRRTSESIEEILRITKPK